MSRFRRHVESDQAGPELARPARAGADRQKGTFSNIAEPGIDRRWSFFISAQRYAVRLSIRATAAVAVATGGRPVVAAYNNAESRIIATRSKSLLSASFA